MRDALHVRHTAANDDQFGAALGQRPELTIPLAGKLDIEHLCADHAEFRNRVVEPGFEHGVDLADTAMEQRDARRLLEQPEPRGGSRCADGQHDQAAESHEPNPRSTLETTLRVNPRGFGVSFRAAPMEPGNQELTLS